MSLTATTAIDADKPKTVANNRVEDHEARIVQLETLLKHFATGIITSPALGTELSKDNGPLSAVKETNLVKAHNANLDVPEKPSTSPATSEGGEHLFNDIDAKENAISLSPMNVQTSVSVEQKNTPDDRARVVFRQWDEKTMNYIDRNVQPQIEMKQDETKVERAFTYRKILSQNGSIVQSSEIDIEDAILYDTIKRIIPQVYPPNFCKTWPALPFKIRLPFNLLVHCYDKLEEFSVADNSDTEAKKRHREDVRLLLEYVRTTTELVEYFKMRKESPNTIAFRYLWTLFPPGIEVVARPFFNQSQLFRTDHEPESTPEDPDERPQMWPLLAWCFDWTGSDWVKSFHEFEIEPYEREKEISALPCYPLKYYQDTNQTKPEEFRATVLEVGNKFKTFCELKGAARMVEYDDLAITVGKARSDALFTVLSLILLAILLLTATSV
jgi:hypothetical protein